MIHPTQVLLVCMVCCIPLAGCGDQEPEKIADVVRPVKALKVGDASVLQRRSFPGRARAAKEVELSFRVGGTLLELPVKVGDAIGKDGVIARLDPATFETEVDRISANLQRAQAALKNATVQLERQTTLFKKGHVAEAALDRYEAQESKAKADVAAQEAALRKAELDLSYTALRAPFSGTVVATYVDNFEDVRAKQRVVRLLDPTQIEMVVNIPESLISLVPQVREVEIVFDAFPEVKVPATIKEIGAEASETTRTYPITLVMDQQEGIQILPGMAGKAIGKPSTNTTAGKSVVVPPAAIFAVDDGKSAVWIIDEGSMTVSRKDVDVGKLASAGIEIRSGLAPGDWIVTAGVHSLKDGQKVRVVEQ